MNVKQYTIVLILAFGAGFVVAYFLLPTKVVTETKTIQVHDQIQSHTVMVAHNGTVTTTIDTSTNHNSAENDYSKTEVNPKKFGIEAGITFRKEIYGHVTYDVWGPVFIGLHGGYIASTSQATAGLGIGLRL